jgi:hypothetical protein
LKLPEYIPIAESQNVYVYCHSNGRYSFFNSPYPAHQIKTGIDIYPGLKFGDIVGCPVNGEVIYVKKVKAPKGQGFIDSGFDTIILLRPNENPNVVVKILHLDSNIKIGEQLNIGDDLGVLLRSGYYGWATLPHFHLEIRPKNDPVRARGGFEINNLNFSSKANNKILSGTITNITPKYCLVELQGSRIGLQGYVNGKTGILDGGIPYYGWLGIHLLQPQEGQILLNGKIIGDIHTVKCGASIATNREFNIKIKNCQIHGLSLYLKPRNNALAQVIPKKGERLNLEVGEEINFEIT